MSKENKPCPFCSGRYLYVIGVGEDDSKERIMCADCGSVGPLAESKEEAWDKWNKRDGEDEQSSH